ncbi:MAG: PAS domain S-box protein [bacterium]|nr:PAS domain S-box protein [bacterium]
MEDSIRDLKKKLIDNPKSGTDNRALESIWAPFDACPLPTLIFSAQGKILKYNEALKLLTGFPREEVKDLCSFFKMTGISNDRPGKSFWEKLVANNNSDVISEKLNICSKNGSVKEVDFSSYTVFKDRQSLKYKILHGLDRGEHRKIDPLDISEERYHQLVKNLKEGVWIIDKDGFTTFVNPQLAEMLDYEINEIVGRHLFTFMDEKALETGVKNLDLREKGVKEQQEFEFIGKNGKRIYTLMSATPILNDEKKYIGAIANVMDITQRKETEAELQKKTHELEERVKELHCIFAITKLLEAPDLTLEKLIDEVLQLIRSSWQYPEITCARITIHGREFKTKNYILPLWKQKADIKIGRKIVGEIEVGYLEEKPLQDEGPFLKEEKYLLGTIAQRLGQVIERFETTERLSRSEEQIRHTFENAPIGIVTINLDGHFRDANHYFCKFIGYSAFDLVSLSTKDITHPEDKEASTLLINKLSRGEISDFAIEIRYDCKSDEEKIGYTRLALLRKQDGSPEFIIGQIEDITQRKENEKELEKHRENLEELVKTRTEELQISNNQLQKEIAEKEKAEEALKLTQFAIDNTGDAAYWLEPDARFIYVNDAAVNMTGYSRDELLNMTVHNISPEFQKDKWDVHWEFLKKRKTVTFETTHRSMDGGVLDVEITSNYVEFGGKEYNCAFVRDITQRKIAENAVRESEKRYRLLLNSITSYVYTVFIESGKPVRTSHGPRCVKLTGYTTEEFDADPFLWFKMVHMDDHEKVKDHAEKLAAGINADALEHRIIRKDGTIRWVRNTPVINFDMDKVPVSYDGIIEDITFRDRGEEVFKILYNILEATVTTTTLEDLLGKFHSEISSLMDAKNFFVAIYDKESDSYTLSYFADQYAQIEKEKTYDLKNSLTDRVFRSKTPLLINKKQIDELINNYEIKSYGEICESWLGVPLMIDEEPIGVVAVQSYISPDSYNRHDLDILSYVARHIAIMIERKTYEESLIDNEKNYRELVEKAGIAISIEDTEGNIKYFNMNNAELFGYTQEEMQCQSIRSLVHPDDLEMVLDYHQKRITGGESHSRYRFRGIRKNSETINLEVDSISLKENGKIIGTRNYIWKIT